MWPSSTGVPSPRAGPAAATICERTGERTRLTGRRRVPRAAPALAVLAVLGLAFGPTGFVLSAPVASVDLGNVVDGPLGSSSAGLSVVGSLGSHPSDPFFAVVLTDAGAPVKSLVSLGSYLNSTPASWFRFGGDGSGYDPTTQTDYVPPSSGVGRYVAVHTQLWNLGWFKAWCASRTSHCEWLGYLPGEENDTTAAVHAASWYHRVLGFAPTYWEFGNEPTNWLHFGKNVSTWSTADHLQPTALGYATMVRNYIAAVSAVYPNDRYVGIESACACASSMVSDTAALAGSSLSAMAYHSYPSGPGSSLKVASFLGVRRSRGNLTTTAATFAGSVAAGCRRCSSIPVDLGEYQAGPYYAFSPLAATYAGAPFLASSLIQAIQANLTQFTVYDSNSLFDEATGTPTYEGRLYSAVLPHLVMGTDSRVVVTGSAPSNVWTLLTKNGSHGSILVVNDDPSNALQLTIGSSVFPVGQTGSYWAWSPPGSALSSHLGVTLPARYTVPAEGILLLSV